MKELLILLAIPVISLGINVGYYFRSSNLILKISGNDESYTVKVASETYTSTETVVIPWEKGMVRDVVIVGNKSGEKERVKIEGVHDSPPHICLDMPKSIGYNEVNVNLKVWDDWDKPDDINLQCFLDGATSVCYEIDPIFLDKGQHIFEVRATDSFGNISIKSKVFAFDPTIPKIPKMSSKSPGIVIFPESPTLRFIMPSLGVQKKVSALKLDQGYILQPVNESGNMGKVFVIPPLPSGLTPLPGRAITSVSGNFILLGSEKYSVVGKVLLPYKKTIAMSENSQIDIPVGSSFIIKGILQTLSKNTTIFGEGGIILTEGGEIYLSNMDFKTHLSANGGKILYLNNVRAPNTLKIVGTNYVVLNKVNLKKLICKNCYGVYLSNLNVDDIVLSDDSEIVLDSVTATNVSVSSFSWITLKNSSVSSISIDTLSRLDAYNSAIGNIFSDKGSFIRIRECKLRSADLKWFSKMEYHNCEVGKISSESSEVLGR